jgi:valyl-tRNA synthetase
VAQATLVRALDVTLRLLHPFAPFITEEIWQKLPRAPNAPETSIMVQRWPERWHLPLGADDEAERAMGFLMEAITAIRTIRVETGIPPGKEIAAAVRTHDSGWLAVLERHRDYVTRLARLGSLDLRADGERPTGAAAAVVQGAEILVPLLGVIDLEAEKKRLEKEIGKVRKDRDQAEGRLANEGFVSRAPAEVVQKERERVTELGEKLRKLEAGLSRLQEISG